MLLGMVVVFQIPTLAFFLAKMRLVTAGFLWRNFKYAFLLTFIVAAFLTPTTDPWDQAVFGAPLARDIARSPRCTPSRTRRSATSSAVPAGTPCGARRL